MKFSSVTVVILAIASSVAEVHSFSLSKHSCRGIISTTSLTNNYRLRAKSNSEEEKTIIDAIVEEKTAGLALDEVGGEENTTVSVYNITNVNLNIINQAQ